MKGASSGLGEVGNGRPTGLVCTLLYTIWLVHRYLGMCVCPLEPSMGQTLSNYLLNELFVYKTGHYPLNRAHNPAGGLSPTLGQPGSGERCYS